VPQITNLPCLADNAGDYITEITFFLDKERKLQQWSSGMRHHVSSVYYYLYTDTAGLSEILVPIYQTTMCYSWEDLNLNIHNCKELKSTTEAQLN
jgi:hypothetical protein